jgi:hypothetical protein
MSISTVEGIQRLAPRIPGWPAAEVDTRLGNELAEALGWTSNGARIEQIVPPENLQWLTQGIVGNQPALILAAGRHPVNQDSLDAAALFAYHSSIEWGLVTSPIETVVFNSHWIRDDNWFQLPPIRWDEAQAYIEIFDAITPDGVTAGRIDAVATGYCEPDRLLRPVDNALVRRLDFWRSEALRHTREIDRIDEKLQILFAQLFVLRAIEDRNLAPELPRLEDTCDDHGEVDISRLDMLFDQAREQVQSELFDELIHHDFPAFVLGGIIHDLYVPNDLPRRGFRYNFSWIDSDVLGSAYEEYLSTILVSIPALSPQLRLFEQPLREVERASVRKKTGVYYTPDFLVKYLTERALDYYTDGSEDFGFPRIADFSCGSGSFLTAAVDSLIRRLRSSDSQRNWGREIVDKKCIVGIDNDRRAVALARLSLWLRLAEEPDPLPLPCLQETILHGDSLSEETFSGIPASYDIILGNPPFIATGKFPSRAELAARFQTAQGRYDYSYLFVELAIRKLNESGVLGMVVPNRLFLNRDAEIIRGMLVDNTRLLTIVDFGSTEVFIGTSAYIGTIVAQKKPARSFRDHVRVINVHQLPPRFVGAKLFEADDSDILISTKYLGAYNTPHPYGSPSWLLLSPTSRQARIRLEESSEPLDSVAGIYQGIRTGANDIFVVEIESYSDGLLAQIRSGLGDVSLVEKSILHPVVFGSEIRRYDIVRPQRYLIYPYHMGSVISEAELREQFPKTHAYFSSYQPLLAGRKSLTGSGLRWYELVRKRDESWLKSRKLLIRDLAIKPSFALDEDGSTFLVGGTAVVPADSSLLLPLLGYLNSSIANWYLRHITPSFRSGFQKFEPQHLQRLPVLSDVINPTALNKQISNLVLRIVEANKTGNLEEKSVCEKQIDDLLSESVGLDISEVQ